MRKSALITRFAEPSARVEEFAGEFVMQEETLVPLVAGAYCIKLAQFFALSRSRIVTECAILPLIHKIISRNKFIQIFKITNNERTY